MWVWSILIYFCWRAVLSQMSLTFSPSQWHVFSFSWWYLFSLRAENFIFNKLSSLVPPLTDLTFGAHAGFFHITSARSIGLHTTPQPVTQFDLMVCQRRGCPHVQLSQCHLLKELFHRIAFTSLQTWIRFCGCFWALWYVPLVRLSILWTPLLSLGL